MMVPHQSFVTAVARASDARKENAQITGRNNPNLPADVKGGIENPFWGLLGKG